MVSTYIEYYLFAILCSVVGKGHVLIDGQFNTNSLSSLFVTLVYSCPLEIEFSTLFLSSLRSGTVC